MAEGGGLGSQSGLTIGIFSETLGLRWERTATKKTVTIRLSDETAAMIDRRRKEWELRNRGEVIERLLGWMIETKDPNE